MPDWHLPCAVNSASGTLSLEIARPGDTMPRQGASGNSPACPVALAAKPDGRSRGRPDGIPQGGSASSGQAGEQCRSARPQRLASVSQVVPNGNMTASPRGTLGPTSSPLPTILRCGGFSGWRRGFVPWREGPRLGRRDGEDGNGAAQGRPRPTAVGPAHPPGIAGAHGGWFAGQGVPAIAKGPLRRSRGEARPATHGRGGATGRNAATAMGHRLRRRRPSPVPDVSVRRGRPRGIRRDVGRLAVHPGKTCFARCPPADSPGAGTSRKILPVPPSLETCEPAVSRKVRPSRPSPASPGIGVAPSPKAGRTQPASPRRPHSPMRHRPRGCRPGPQIRHCILNNNRYVCRKC
jgi:hypothetical protein